MTPTLEQIERGLAIRHQIAALETELTTLFTPHEPRRIKASLPHKRGSMSTAARKRISDAMKARWAARRKA